MDAVIPADGIVFSGCHEALFFPVGVTVNPEDVESAAVTTRNSLVQRIAGTQIKKTGIVRVIASEIPLGNVDSVPDQSAFREELFQFAERVAFLIAGSGSVADIVVPSESAELARIDSQATGTTLADSAEAVASEHASESIFWRAEHVVKTFFFRQSAVGRKFEFPVAGSSSVLSGRKPVIEIRRVLGDADSDLLEVGKAFCRLSFLSCRIQRRKKKSGQNRYDCNREAL